MTGFAEKCIIILNRQVVNETMTESECRYITELLWKACVHLFRDDEELIGEVHENMKSIIRLMSDDLEDALQSIEVSIRNAIIQSGKDGRGREEVSEFIQNVFMLQKEEAEEKMKLYWKE